MKNEVCIKKTNKKKKKKEQEPKIDKEKKTNLD